MLEKLMSAPDAMPHGGQLAICAAAAVAAKDKRGVCIRLEDEDFEDETTLGTDLGDLLKLLKVPIQEADLVVDFKALGTGQVRTLVMTVRSLLAVLPSVKSWRSLTLAATAFPENLAAFPSASISTTPRAEWTLWSALASRSKSLPRMPTFGDYGIQHPEPAEIDPRLMQMTANLRYTIDQDWMILKARVVRKYGYDQFNDICKQLVTLSEYRKAKHCWGCDYVSLCAAGKEGPGNAMIWRKVGTVHHLTVVAEQISNFPWP